MPNESVFDRQGNRFAAIVEYDYDLGWICLEWQDGQYEAYYEDWSNVDEEHSEQGRIIALAHGIRFAKENGGRVLHYYEFPEAIQKKHQEYSYFEE